MNDSESSSISRRVFQLAETIMVTALGGAVFTWLHAPLAWMLGPLTAVLLWQGFTKRVLLWPIAFRNAGLLLLGYGMGLSFTVESAKQIAAQLPSMLAATALTVGFSLLLAFWISKAAGISAQTGLIGSIPGGLSQMVVLSEEIAGADKTVVTFMQTIRLLSVIFIVPFLAVHGLNGGTAAGSLPVLQTTAEALTWSKVGLAAIVTLAAAWAAVRLHLPTPWFLGPIIGSALLMVSAWVPPQLPSGLVLAAQWSLGIYLGLGIRFDSLQGWRRLLPYSLLGGIAIVVFSLGLSYVYSKIHPISMATAFLSTAPGGMTEMGVTAAIVHADVSMVVAYQMFRILFILFIVPYVLRWMFRGTKEPSS